MRPGGFVCTHSLIVAALSRPVGTVGVLRAVPRAVASVRGQQPRAATERHGPARQARWLGWRWESRGGPGVSPMPGPIPSASRLQNEPSGYGLRLARSAPRGVLAEISRPAAPRRAVKWCLPPWLLVDATRRSGRARGNGERGEGARRAGPPTSSHISAPSRASDVTSSALMDDWGRSSVPPSISRVIDATPPLPRRCPVARRLDQSSGSSTFCH